MRALHLSLTVLYSTLFYSTLLIYPALFSVPSIQVTFRILVNYEVRDLCSVPAGGLELRLDEALSAELRGEGFHCAQLCG